MEELHNEVIDKLKPIAKIKRFKKGELINSKNRLYVKILIVKSGILRSFYTTKDKDITAHFAAKYGIIGAADSVIKSKKSRYNIEALEDSEVYEIDNNELEDFLTVHPELERVARRFTQLIYLDLVERFEGMMFLTAKERYEHFMARYPRIRDKVSLKHIASYLGITQETLSRVRAEY